MKTEKRKAKVGERIVITDDFLSSGEYKMGDILTVEKSVPEVVGVLGHIIAQGMDNIILDNEYEVIVDEKETKADNVEIIEKLQAELEALKEYEATLEKKFNDLVSSLGKTDVVRI
ncbi:hypothetical protein [Bacillus smithii]|uniref:hypothetical protein n=1 Tax=Bacillus smithii TaxID=1479 RepID=UPI003D232CA4